VWESYLDVVAAMSMCAVIVTDSGSIVEESNVLQVPCVTLRFGSDRSETFLAGSNFLAPPIDRGLVVSVIHQVFEHRGELSWDRVYPEGASRMLVDAVERRLADDSLLISEEWRYGLQAQLR
jgi:UDP-N-acetylglucosamine 2-epimerase (non-hydrolysing)